jgi:hypothetical protein
MKRTVVSKRSTSTKSKPAKKVATKKPASKKVATKSPAKKAVTKKVVKKTVKTGNKATTTTRTKRSSNIEKTPANTFRVRKVINGKMHNISFKNRRDAVAYLDALNG